MRLARIYTLHDPDGSVRYVGYTIATISRRRDGHVRWARAAGKTTHLANWLRSLTTPQEVRLVEETTEELAGERERFWIAHFRQAGCRLVNSTDGGRGTLGHKQTAEQIAKRVAKLTGHPCSEATRAAISAANLGRKRTVETRAVMRDLKLGKPWTQARRAAHVAKYGIPPPITDPRFCEYCGRGPFKGPRGLKGHYQNSHDGAYRVGSYRA